MVAIKNKYIMETATMKRVEVEQKESRLKLHGYMFRRYEDNMRRRVMETASLRGRSRKGRPKTRFIDSVNDDIKELKLRVEDPRNRKSCRRAMLVTPKRSKAENRKVLQICWRPFFFKIFRYS